MAEGLVGDQAGDGGIGDHVVNAGGDWLGQSQLVSQLQHILNLRRQACHDLSNGIVVRTLKHLNHLIVILINQHHVAVDPGIVLIQLPVLRNKQLGHFKGANTHHSIENMLAAAQQVCAQIFTELQQLGIGESCEVTFSAERLHQRLVLEHYICNTLHRCAQPEGLGDGLGQSCNIGRDIIDRVFKDNTAVAHLHHKTALCIPAGENIGSIPVHTDGFTLNVHAQDADIVKVAVKRRYQSFGSFSSGI